MLDIDDMRNSWLKAVGAGEADGFSRHFVPEILEEIASLRAELESEKAKKIPTDSEWLSAIKAEVARYRARLADAEKLIQDFKDGVKENAKRLAAADHLYEAAKATITIRLKIPRDDSRRQDGTLEEYLAQACEDYSSASRPEGDKA